MKKLILSITTLVMMGLLVVSCNNDDGIECPEAFTGELDANETEFSGRWLFAGMVADQEIDITDDGEDNPSTDIYAQYTDCQSDLEYNFMDNRNYTLKQGFLAPDCETQVSQSGTWRLNGNTLAFVTNCSTQSVNIEINETSDIFTYEANLNFQDVNGAISTAAVTFTYEKVVE